MTDPAGSAAHRPAVVAVVLAGGTSRRFGRDKLAADPGDAPTLLDAALAALPPAADVVVVGPARETVRPVRFVREEPPGGGPAAGLVTGLATALASGAELVLVLPADAPHAGRAAGRLLDLLIADPGVPALVATDDEDREQPLQLALRAAAARRLLAAAPDGARDASARALVRTLDPPATRVRLRPDELFDVDTPAQLAAWRARTSAAVDAVLARVADVRRTVGPDRPVVLVLQGPPAQTATLAAALRLRAEATGVVVRQEGDPALAGEVGGRPDLVLGPADFGYVEGA